LNPLPAKEKPMFIQTEATPNPATLKFLPGRPVLETGTLDLRDPAEAAKSSPLAERLFAIEGVDGVFFGSDFITVSKSAGEWPQLKPAILGAIMEHFMSGAPLLNAGEDETGAADEFFETADEEIVTTIKDLIETRVRPAVANDGRLLGLPVIDRDAAPRHPEPAAALRARSRRGAAGLTAHRGNGPPAPERRHHARAGDRHRA
jgi:hypothetical protein